ncbi:hypothetical protein [Pseudoalteromonas umbrosa]|uniref:hypothetical protein n=1 Tax=Pseudoalteromonas umbrosa TaxID=3048489 RepID=UPI0024C43369|nr:hypothetical protein [Pseudoalteromonas sp. B95]MDK1288602.1 hypothetical protein [Pseudoalteromonas sp. B95]
MSIRVIRLTTVMVSTAAFNYTFCRVGDDNQGTAAVGLSGATFALDSPSALLSRDK